MDEGPVEVFAHWGPSAAAAWEQCGTFFFLFLSFFLPSFSFFSSVWVILMRVG